MEGGRQVVDITVKGGYSPSLIRVEAGTPVRLRFRRQENSDCTARVVFPDLRKSASLEAFGTTTLDLDLAEPGGTRACGMDMLHGTLVAEAARGVDSATVDGGAERAVLTDDPDLLVSDALTKAVAEATGLPVRLRPEPGTAGTEDAEAAANHSAALAADSVECAQRAADTALDATDALMREVADEEL